MNVLHMKYASVVAETGSLNAAAKKLYLAPPNLSRSIKELEHEIGITVFDRSAKGMTLTPEGAEFIRYARNVLKQIDDIEMMYRAGVRSKTRFSISVPRASYLSDALARFSKSIGNDPVEIYYKETNPSRAIKNILEADYKLGIIRYSENYDKYFRASLEEKGLAYEPVAEFTYVVVMSKESPLAKKQVIRFSDLSPYIEIAHGDPFVPSLPMELVKKEELPDNIERRILVYERASQFDLLSENHDTFMWMSPLPQKLLERYSLVQKESPDNKKVYKDVLIHRKDYVLTELDKAFIKEVRKSSRDYL